MARGSKNGKAEMHPLLPSGDWEGFFTYQLFSGHKGRMDCVLYFKNNLITGEGSDEVGHFNWKGHYELDSLTCALVKTYPGRHSVHYKGHIDENGIWGTWSIEKDWSGGFHIWPKKKEAAQASVKVATRSKVLQSTR